MTSKIKTAVIMAAGLGTRFGEMTESMPKGFIEVAGKSMILRSVDTLIACGIERIIVGTGYRKEMYEQLMSIYPQIECCFSEKYATTNSMWTLYNCKELIGDDDFILLESDLIFDKKAITSLLETSLENAILVAELTKFQDQYFVEYNDDGIITNCSTDSSALNVCGELVGIHKLSNTFFKELCYYYNTVKEEKPKLGYEFALLEMSKMTMPIYACKIENISWYEIDDEVDLKYAEENVVNIICH